MTVNRLLAADETPPFETVNADGRGRAVIICDHAGNRVPRSLDRLGLDDQALSLHIAYDIGGERLARELASLLDAPLVLSRFSRLVVDLNRHLDDPTSIPEVSDGVRIPGNEKLSRAAAGQRIEEIFVPYHNAVASLLEHVHSTLGVPALISVHSFTPRFRGFDRPWHVGVLWNRDGRIARPLIEGLRRRPDIHVGDNQPYHARDPVGYSMDTHAECNGYPHVLLEMRQDLIADQPGALEWAAILHAELHGILADPALYEVLAQP